MMVKDWRGQDEGKREGELWSSPEASPDPILRGWGNECLGNHGTGPRPPASTRESNSANNPWETPISFAPFLAAAWLSPRAHRAHWLPLLRSSQSILEAISQLLMHTQQTHFQLPGRELHNRECAIHFLLRPGNWSYPSILPPCLSHEGDFCQHQSAVWPPRADLAAMMNHCWDTRDLFILLSLNPAPWTCL